MNESYTWKGDHDVEAALWVARLLGSNEKTVE